MLSGTHEPQTVRRQFEPRVVNIIFKRHVGESTQSNHVVSGSLCERQAEVATDGKGLSQIRCEKRGKNILRARTQHTSEEALRWRRGSLRNSRPRHLRHRTGPPPFVEHRIDDQFHQVTSPPTIGAAIRFITSATAPVDQSIGIFRPARSSFNPATPIEKVTRKVGWWTCSDHI